MEKITKEQCIKVGDDLIKNLNDAGLGEDLKEDISKFKKFTDEYSSPYNEEKFSRAAEKMLGRPLSEQERHEPFKAFVETVNAMANLINIHIEMLSFKYDALSDKDKKEIRQTNIEAIKISLQDIQNILDLHSFQVQEQQSMLKGKSAESRYFN